MLFCLGMPVTEAPQALHHNHYILFGVISSLSKMHPQHPTNHQSIAQQSPKTESQTINTERGNRA